LNFERIESQHCIHLTLRRNAIENEEIVIPNLMIVILLYIPVLFGYSIEVYFIHIAIAVPLFFIWKRILRNKLQDTTTRKIIAWAATIVTTPIIYAGLMVLFIYYLTYTPKRHFDKSSWLRLKSERFEMAEDLINSKQLIGKDTFQLKQLLGNPSMVYESSSNGDHLKSWSYDMGSGGGGLGFLFHDLSVKLKDDKVVKVEHIEIKD